MKDINLIGEQYQDVINEIAALKQEKNAVILAHYYVRPEVQAIADYIGDSFYLSKIVDGLDAQTVVFAGVFFMGESAKVLNPNKTILLPDVNADCAMAHMADVATIQKMREQYDDLAVVCYINSTIELKQHSDVCVTSSNAVKIVKALPNKNIFFIPDRNLARYVTAQVPEKNFVFNEGYCPIHEAILLSEVKELQENYPNALLLAHPECKQELLEMADYIGSTAGIIEFATQSNAKEFIICTENGIRYELERKNPDKKFYFTKTEPVCPDMKMVTLEKIRDVLKEGSNDVQVTDQQLIEESKKSLARMLELGK